MGGPWKHDAKWKKPVTKHYLLYDSVYVKCPEYANLLKQKVDGDCLELEGRERRACEVMDTKYRDFFGGGMKICSN